MLKKNRSAPNTAVIPVLYYPDVPEAVAWLTTALPFTERLRNSRDRRQLLSIRHFDKSAAVIEGQIEATFTKQLGRSFYTIVRSVEELQSLIERDPYSGFALPSNAKRVVTFARRLPALKSRLPIERDGAQILAVKHREAFSAHVPGPKGAVFMELN